METKRKRLTREQKKDKAIIDLINSFEPRVEIIDVEIFDNIDNNAISVTLTFKIVNTSTPIVLDVVLERTR